MKKIIVNRSHIDITDYELGENPSFEKSLSTYDRMYYKYNPIGFIYEKENKIMKVSSGLDLNYLSSKLDRIVENNYECDPYESISIRLKGLPRSKLQQEAIQFLVGEGDFSYSRVYSQLMLNLDTGEGKTYCAIAASTFLKSRVLIITHQTNIKTQWIDAYLNFTDIDERCIVNLDSSARIERYLNDERKLEHVKVFTVNHATLRSIVNHYGVEYLTEMFKTLKIGLKIYDEAHLEFENILLIDSYTNTKKTIYLTATVGRSNIDENKIYMSCFKGIPKYEQVGHGYTDSRKHITYLAYFYNSNPSYMEKVHCTNKYGFDGIKYSKYQTNHAERLLPHLVALIKKFANDPNYTCLVTMATIDGCDAYQYLLQEEFPDMNIKVYHSKLNKNEKDEALEKANIIVSTSKSLGTGKNIPNLRVVINCEAFGSKIIGIQTSGRLRVLPDGKNSLYVEMIDLGFKNIKNQYNRRLKHYKQTFGKLISVTN